MSTISYAITAHNEHEELEHLLSQLNTGIKWDDEVVIQLDIKATDEVKEVCYKFPFFTLIEHPLNNDFSSFKNNLKSKCNRDYIFQIDADEFLSDILLSNINEILSLNPEIDIYGIPRVNKVEGLTVGHIKKWGWNVKEGIINWPDYQWRICKNIPSIHWVGKVHERLVGSSSIITLPDEFCLLHFKTIERQEKQNEYYNELS